MSREDVVVVAIRLFAIFLAVTALRFAVQAVGAPFDIPIGDLILGVALTVAVPLVAASLLWFFPVSIAAKLLPVMESPGTPIVANGAAALDVGCTLIGLWLLASALADAGYWTVILIAAAHNDWADGALATEDVANIIATVVQVFMALGLLLGYRQILKALHGLRSYGVSR